MSHFVTGVASRFVTVQATQKLKTLKLESGRRSKDLNKPPLGPDGLTTNPEIEALWKNAPFLTQH